MLGQINDTAQLHGNGKTLLVTGWVRFDSDEESAVFRVTVTQGDSTVTGRSGKTSAPKRAWVAEVEVEEGEARFFPGSAHAVVTAEVELKNGESEEYPESGDDPWERYITLVG